MKGHLRKSINVLLKDKGYEDYDNRFCSVGDWNSITSQIEGYLVPAMVRFDQHLVGVSTNKKLIADENQTRNVQVLGKVVLILDKK